MQYLYYFANTSLVLRILTYLAQNSAVKLESLTVIYRVDRWILRVNTQEVLTPNQDFDFVAFLKENGSPYTLTPRIAKVFEQLDEGTSITAVMNRHHIVVVSHGALNPEDVESFRTTFVQGLGYCPPSLV